MSRLIFEGDTTERFGEIYPKPFIDEIRVYDNEVQADISFYFQTEEDTLTEDLLSSLSGYRLYSGFGNNSDDGYVFSEFNISPDPFYNSDGDKFIKIMITRDFLIDEITKNTYIFCCSTINDLDVLESQNGSFASRFGFTDTVRMPGLESENDDMPDLSDIDPSNGYRSIKNISSDLSFEKVFDKNGSLDTKRRVLFIKSDGNTYPKTPIMSLDRQYRETTRLNHSQIISTISSIIQPTINNIPESDLVAATLQQNSNSPRLLLILQRNINNFSNKSTSTTTGELYGQLVDAIINFDNILRSSEIVEKRLFINRKIVDLRNTNIISSADSLPINVSSRKYLHMPFITRRIEPRDTDAEPAANNSNPEYYYLVRNDFYLLFDYEKNLYKESEISKLFNSYNIMQIFGLNSLNGFYKIKQISASRKNTSQGDTNVTHKILYEGQGSPSGLPGPLDLPPKEYLDNNENTTEFGLGEIKEQEIRDETGRVKTIRSHMAERSFDTLSGLNDYRMKLYKILDFQKLEEIEDISEYRVAIEVDDSTMEFYDLFIKRKMQSLNEKLQEYTLLSQDFCAFNNLNDEFNDFFVDYVRDLYDEPYPWTEGPLYFYLMTALIQASWHNGDINSGRKRDGSLINLEEIKNLAIIRSNQISPENGKLSQVIEFSEQFKSLFETFFEVGSGLDSKFDLYGMVGSDIDPEDIF